MVEVSSPDKSGNFGRPISISKSRSKQFKIQETKYTIEESLCTACAECTISHLSITPLTPPHKHSLVKPSLGRHPTVQEDKSDTGIDEVEDVNSANLNSIHNQSKE